MFIFFFDFFFFAIRYFCFIFFFSYNKTGISHKHPALPRQLVSVLSVAIPSRVHKQQTHARARHGVNYVSDHNRFYPYCVQDEHC